MDCDPISKSNDTTWAQIYLHHRARKYVETLRTNCTYTQSVPCKHTL
jgi:hypothetical protein